MSQQQASSAKKEVPWIGRFLRRAQPTVRGIFILLILAVAVNWVAGVLNGAPKDFETSLFLNWLKGAEWYQITAKVFLIVFGALFFIAEAYVAFRPDKSQEWSRKDLEKIQNGIEAQTAQLKVLDLHLTSITGHLQAIASNTKDLMKIQDDIVEQKEPLKTLLDPITIHLQTIARNSEALEVMLRDNNAIHEHLHILVSNTSALDILKTFRQDIQDLRSDIQAISTNAEPMHHTLHQDGQVLQPHLKPIEANMKPAVEDNEPPQTLPVDTISYET